MHVPSLFFRLSSFGPSLNSPKSFKQKSASSLTFDLVTENVFSSLIKNWGTCSLVPCRRKATTAWTSERTITPLQNRTFYKNKCPPFRMRTIKNKHLPAFFGKCFSDHLPSPTNQWHLATTMCSEWMAGFGVKALVFDICQSWQKKSWLARLNGRIPVNEILDEPKNRNF